MRIGLLGGTFDPIHYGHIRPALEVKQTLGLDNIWLMPNHIPPHKKGVSAAKHRLAMVQQVCDAYDEFDLCRIEIETDTPSYSVKTLEALTQQYPEHHFVFIMGTDSLLSLPTWYQYQKLFELCDIAVMQRPHYLTSTHSELQSRYFPSADINKSTRGRIFQIQVLQQPFSSTQVRKSFRDNQQTSLALLPETEAYIKRMKLY